MTPSSTQTSKPNTDDVRIREIKELVPPAHVFREYPVSSRAAQTTYVVLALAAIAKWHKSLFKESQTQSHPEEAWRHR